MSVAVQLFWLKARHATCLCYPQSIEDGSNQAQVEAESEMAITVDHQVGRLQPLEDAAAVLHIREAVGMSVELRADANQKWCLSEALQFGHAVKAAGLEVVLTRHTCCFCLL